MPDLFSPLTIRAVTFRNRIAVSPICEYSSDDGFANDWHPVHLGSRAVGGAALAITEAAAVEPRGGAGPPSDDIRVPGLGAITRFAQPDAGGPSRPPAARGPSPRPAGVRVGMRAGP